MTDNDKPSTNMNHTTKIKKLTEESNRDDAPKHKLRDELQEYKKALTRERDKLKLDTKKNQTMINELTLHVGSVSELIQQIGNNELKKVLNRAQANETALAESICKLKEQVTAKSKNPVSFKPILDEFKKIENLLKK